MSNTANKRKPGISMTSNYFSTGGGGVNFEHKVQASFLLAMLVDGFSPLLDDPITSIHFQSKRQYDIDDVLIESDNNSYKRKLLCQIKHGIKVSPNNTFQSVINAAWSDFYNPTFDKLKDKIVLITNDVPNIESIKFIYSQANAASCAEDFNNRFFTPGLANKTKKDKFQMIQECLKKANQNQDLSKNQIWDFCKVFTALVFDLDFESSVNQFLIHGLIASSCTQEAPLLWSSLIAKSAEYDQNGSYITIDKIPNSIRSKFKKTIYMNQSNSLLSLSDNSALYNGLSLTQNRKNQEPSNNGYYVNKERIDNKKNTIVSTVDDKIVEKNPEFRLKEKNEAKYSFDFSSDLFLTKMAMVGSWDEKNSFDISFLESFINLDYKEIRLKIQESNYQTPSLFCFHNGKWHLDQQKELILSCPRVVFDDTADSLFSNSTKILLDIDKKINNNNILSDDNRFLFSNEIRTGISTGLAIVGANANSFTNCSNNHINYLSQKLLNTVLSTNDYTIWASLYSLLPIIAEINPYYFLIFLEDNLNKNPSTFEALFPTKNTNVLFSRNYICSILWSLEKLAWIDDYFIKSIRILSALADLKYEETNYANTPINSIVSILLPWHIQTMASSTTRTNALKAVLFEHPQIAWKVIIKLLPGVVQTTSDTEKPQYIISEPIPEILYSQKEIDDDFSFYSDLALNFAQKDNEKLYDLLSHNRLMGEESLQELLKIIISNSELWNDERKYQIWKTLLVQKQSKQDTTSDKQNQLIKSYDKAIACCEPLDIRTKSRLIYDEEYLFLKTNVPTIDRYNQIKIEKCNISYNIYKEFGISSLIEFGKTVNNPSSVFFYLGCKTNTDELQTIINQSNNKEIEIDIIKSIIGGFTSKNDPSVLFKLKFDIYEPEFSSLILSFFIPCQKTFNFVHKILNSNDHLYWEKIHLTGFENTDNADISIIWSRLLSVKRYRAAINLFEYKSPPDTISPLAIKDTLLNSMTDSSKDSFQNNAVRNLIDFLQKKNSISFDELSEIEFFFLPLLDKESDVKPLALRYRLANEPEYFFNLLQFMYKKHSGEKPKISKGISERLFSIFFKYDIVPGTTLEGTYDKSKFISWIEKCKEWSKTSDIGKKALQIIGNGLSYATINQTGVWDDFIMAELNKKENEDMRIGFQIGIFNQRGAFTVDPEGKPELELAEKYDKKAKIVESFGYAIFAETLHIISNDYRNEAKERKKEIR